MRHDPPRIVWSGRVWTSETEVPMPIPPQLPDGFQLIAYVNEQGCPEVSIVVDHVEVSRYAFSQSVDELRAERERIARAAQEGEG